MKGIQRIINAVRTESPLLELIRSGISPQQIKDLIISDFGQFFINKEKLMKYSTTNLVSDWILFSKYRKDDFFIKMLNQTLELYQTAMQKNPQDCVGIITGLVNHQLETGNRFWSFVLTEASKSELELYEYTFTVMDDIGKIVEGLSKTLLLEFTGMHKVGNDKQVLITEIMKQDLGVVNNYLLQDSRFSDVFSVNNIKLSDWRNIAYHHNYLIQGESICCKYGPKENRKTIYLKRDELWNVLTDIVRILDLLNLNHKLFFYDYEDLILKDFKPEVIEGDARPEIWFLTLASGLSAQGFEVIDFVTSSDLTRLVLRESIVDVDTKTRAIHSSQFTYNLWYYSSSKNLEVEYRLANDQVYLISSTTSDICEKIGNKEETLSYLAEHINFNFVKN